MNARGEVVWATSSGRCGIKFLDLPQQTARELDEWTLAKLLEGASPLAHPTRPMLPVRQSPINQPASAATSKTAVEKSTGVTRDEEEIGQSAAEAAPSDHDNLIISPGRVPVIDLPALSIPKAPASLPAVPDTALLADQAIEPSGQLDWLSQPLSSRGLAWTINTLVVVAAWLLSVLVFLSVLREIPQWPFSMVLGAAIVVAALYWGFFRIFAGASLGVKLAQLTEPDPDQEEPQEDRFR